MARRARAPPRARRRRAGGAPEARGPRRGGDAARAPPSCRGPPCRRSARAWRRRRRQRILVARRPAARVAARAKRAVRLADPTSARAGVDSPAPPSRWRPAGPAQRFAVLGCYQARLPQARRVLAPPRRCSRTRRRARARSSLPEHARASPQVVRAARSGRAPACAVARRSKLVRVSTPRTDPRRRVAKVAVYAARANLRSNW